jgi:hypothetical protein
MFDFVSETHPSVFPPYAGKHGIRREGRMVYVLLAKSKAAYVSHSVPQPTLVFVFSGKHLRMQNFCQYFG